MIKAVFFDVGSTLLYPNPDIDGVFYEVARGRGHSVSLEDAHAKLPEVNRFYEEEYLKDGDFWCSREGAVEMYLEMYRYLSRLMGLEEDEEPIAQEVYSRYLKPRYWRIIDDVLPCLKELKGMRLRLGVVSNWSSNLPDLLRGLSLLPYFEEVVASAEVGYRKPSPVIFELMLERMGVAPFEAVHVGDKPDADGVGAQAAGITPVIIDRQGGQPAGFICIRSLSELAGVVARL